MSAKFQTVEVIIQFKRGRSAHVKDKNIIVYQICKCFTTNDRDIFCLRTFFPFNKNANEMLLYLNVTLKDRNAN